MLVGRLIWSEEFLIWGGKGGIEGWGGCSSFLTGKKGAAPLLGWGVVLVGLVHCSGAAAAHLLLPASYQTPLISLFWARRLNTATHVSLGLFLRRKMATGNWRDASGLEGCLIPYLYRDLLPIITSARELHACRELWNSAFYLRSVKSASVQSVDGEDLVLKGLLQVNPAPSLCAPS